MSDPMCPICDCMDEKTCIKKNKVYQCNTCLGIFEVNGPILHKHYSKLDAIYRRLSNAV